METQRLKSLYDEKLSKQVKSNYCPFFVRRTEIFDGKNGILFVGKAENMSNKESEKMRKEKDSSKIIEMAFNIAQGKFINKDDLVKKPMGKTNNSAYNRVVHKLAGLMQKKGISSFARTNLYKLAVTKDYKFGSGDNKAFFDIFKMEIEILQPKYVIFLTGGLEEKFLTKLGSIKVKYSIPFSYMFKKNEQSKEIHCKTIEEIDSVFITAFHPQGKPEKELVSGIMDIVDCCEKECN